MAILVKDMEILTNFATAIAEMAAEDYIWAYRYYIHHPTPPKGLAGQKEHSLAMYTIQDCERFFNSEMFATICPGINPEWFIKNLKEEARYSRKTEREVKAHD